jgi:hypothetical protein
MGNFSCPLWNATAKTQVYIVGILCCLMLQKRGNFFNTPKVSMHDFNKTIVSNRTIVSLNFQLFYIEGAYSLKGELEELHGQDDANIFIPLRIQIIALATSQ